MEKTNILTLLEVGHQNCSDLHEWGPGMRPCFILHYIKRGSGTLKTEYGTFFAGQGQCFFIWPYAVIHYFPNPEDPWEYEWVNFEGEFAEELLLSGSISPKNPILTPQNPNRFLTYFDLLLQMDIYHCEQKEAVCLLGAILSSFSKEASPSESFLPSPAAGIPRLDEALLLIKTNYHRSSFDIESLCQMLRINRMTLYRDFNSHFQMSPKKYLDEYRISQAELMLQKGASVKTAALSCGYSDPLYFSKAFKKARGVTPKVIKLPTFREGL